MSRLFYYVISYLLLQIGGDFLTVLTDLSSEIIVSFDLVMGVVWIFLYFRLVDVVSKQIKLISACYYLGHALHVVSNYLNDGTNEFITFLDDELSHAIIFAAGVLMWLMLIKAPKKIIVAKVGSGLLALIFALVLALSTLEAQLVLFMLPALSWLAYKAYNNLDLSELVYFKFLAFLITIVIILGWGIYFGGFPEPLTVI